MRPSLYIEIQKWAISMHEIDEWQIGAVAATSAHHAIDKLKQDRLLHLAQSSPSRKRTLVHYYSSMPTSLLLQGISWDEIPSFGIT